MEPKFRLTAVAAVFVPLALSACNSDAGTSLPGLAHIGSGTQFSQQDKRVAEALSIGSVRSLSNENGSYPQAVLCDMALDAVIERLSEGQSATLPQVGTLRRAVDVYRQRAVRLAKQSGKSPADMKTDLQAAAAQAPELSERGEIAIGCLRNLA